MKSLKTKNRVVTRFNKMNNYFECLTTYQHLPIPQSRQLLQLHLHSIVRENQPVIFHAMEWYNLQPRLLLHQNQHTIRRADNSSAGLLKSTPGRMATPHSSSKRSHKMAPFVIPRFFNFSANGVKSRKR